jgi:hypothetical protein
MSVSHRSEESYDIPVAPVTKAVDIFVQIEIPWPFTSQRIIVFMNLSPCHTSPLSDHRVSGFGGRKASGDIMFIVKQLLRLSVGHK